MGDGRIEYGPNNPRLPIFYKRFHDLTDSRGGVTAVSEITGISRPTITFWYNGQRTPDAENLGVLSRTLGVSADWLLGLSNEDNSTNDEKLRMVSEYVGLSNSAVSELHKMTSGSDGSIKGKSYHLPPAPAEREALKALDILLTTGVIGKHGDIGKLVLWNIYLFLRGDFDSYSIPHKESNDELQEFSNSIFLCKDKKAIVELSIGNISQSFLVSIQNGLRRLKDYLDEREGK